MLSTGFVFAHQTGQSLIQTGEKYIIDVGYDSITASPTAGETTAFDFLFFNKEGNNPADYTDVAVYITKQGGATVFYSDILHSVGIPTGMAYVFPKSGNYKVAVYFKKDGQTLDQASFPLVASKADYEQPPESPKKYWTNFLSGGIVGMLVLGLTMAFWGLTNKKKRH